MIALDDSQGPSVDRERKTQKATSTASGGTMRKEDIARRSSNLG